MKSCSTYGARETLPKKSRQTGSNGEGSTCYIQNHETIIRHETNRRTVNMDQRTSMTAKPEQDKPKRGRPETRVLKIDTTPEILAKCIVTPIKKPDRPSVSPNDKKLPPLEDIL